MSERSDGLVGKRGKRRRTKRAKAAAPQARPPGRKAAVRVPGVIFIPASTLEIGPERRPAPAAVPPAETAAPIAAVTEAGPVVDSRIPAVAVPEPVLPAGLLAEDLPAEDLPAEDLPAEDEPRSIPALPDETAAPETVPPSIVLSEESLEVAFKALVASTTPSPGPDAVPHGDGEAAPTAPAASAQADTASVGEAEGTAMRAQESAIDPVIAPVERAPRRRFRQAALAALVATAIPALAWTAKGYLPTPAIGPQAQPVRPVRTYRARTSAARRAPPGPGRDPGPAADPRHIRARHGRFRRRTPRAAFPTRERGRAGCDER